MAGETTIYRQKVTFCGKSNCRKCHEGIGHGPYWYAYQTVNGRAVQTYIGKDLPPAIAEEASLPAALIRLRVLGQVRLERRPRGSDEGWYPLRDATWPAPIRTLLGALASSQERRLSLSQVRELLGGKSTAADMQRVIDRLQHLLEPPRRANQQHVLMTRLVEVTSDSLSLADQSRLWIDADAFESLSAAARAADQSSEQERLLTEALALYRGDYWPASSEREASWVLARRQVLRRQWLGLLLDLAELRRGCGATEGAMTLLDQLFTVDPTNEVAVQRLMLLLAQSSRRGEALRLYQRFAAALTQDDHLLPAPETQRLYEAIRSGETPQQLPAPAVLPPQQLPHMETHVVAPVGRSNQSRLVGRDQELATLRQLLFDTEQHHQQIASCVLLTGEAGIGKTRLVEELGRESAQRGWSIAWGRAYAQEVGIPYRLWTESLRKVMLHGLGLRQELTHRPFLYQPLLTLLPDLEDLLLPGQAAPAAEQEPVRMWEAIRALLLAFSERTPLLIVLDDVQWADNSSCDLLAYLVRQLRASPVLIACTCRESELSPSHPLRAVLRDLQREEALVSMAVPPLSNEQIRALVATLPEELVRDIQVRAGGNPFFAEELARTSDLPSALPDTITAVLDVRLSRVSEACQQMLTRAAVLGGSFEFAALHAMERGSGTPSEDTLLDLLEEALAAGVLIEEGSGTRTTYTFWHPLAVGHLYGRLSAARRSSLHRRAADALQEIYAGREEEGAAAIVYHLTSGGGDPASIAAFAELAGGRAYRLSAYPDAEQYYRLVTEQWHQLPLPATRDGQWHQALIFERLGECAMVQGHYDEARRCYERVLEARGSQAEIPLDAYEAQVQALVWSEVAWAWRYTGETTQAWQCSERGEALLRTAGVVAGSAWASLRYQHGNWAWQESRYQEAEQAARAALALFEEHLRQAAPPRAGRASTRLQRTLEGDPVNPGRVHILLAAIQATIGQSAAAASHLQTALIIFEQEDRQREIAIVTGNLGDLYLRQAAYEQAQASFRRSLNIAERMGDLPIACVNYGNLGVLAGRQGNLADAEHLLRRALTLAEHVGDPVYQCLWLAYLAFSLQEAGKDEEARGCIRRALTLSRAKGLAVCAGFALVTLGQMRLAQARAAWAVHEHTELRDADSRLLRRARTTLLHALANDELETEMRVEGQTALAEVLLLLGVPVLAEQYARQALAEARRAELTRLAACAERLLEKAQA